MRIALDEKTVELNSAQADHERKGMLFQARIDKLRNYSWGSSFGVFVYKNTKWKIISPARKQIAISGPLIYPSQIQSTSLFQTKYPPKPSLPTHEVEIQIPSKEKKDVSITRDVGTQSISAYVKVQIVKSAPTPSIEEMSMKLSEAADSSSPMTTPSIKEMSSKHSATHSPVTTPKLNSEQEDHGGWGTIVPERLDYEDCLNRLCASGSERNRRERRQKKKESKAEMQAIRWVLVMEEFVDEKNKA
ncbi:hypothetical protein HAX54_034807 [Datura stramonium]|uniref:Uncharacterized protein n=1 Tax=Datura stramonium TaxID=4076 RepID=A0ABS8VFY7_DATST|nr:hypothetical protein [Datura stramonium]